MILTEGNKQIMNGLTLGTGGELQNSFSGPQAGIQQEVGNYWHDTKTSIPLDIKIKPRK